MIYSCTHEPAELIPMSMEEEMEQEMEEEIWDKSPNLPEQPFNYSNQALPATFTQSPMDFFYNEPGSNPITDHGATLGRVLFYDQRLSINNQIACANCHLQEFAFSDGGNQYSEGFEGVFTTRNSMSLTNMGYGFSFFWDGRVVGLENQVLQPIEHPEEMGQPLDSLVSELNETDFYPALFENAFGSQEINTNRIRASLAQYLRSIFSYRSKYDEGLTNGFVNFTEQEELGRALFFNGQTSCNQCHSTASFAIGNISNNGLDLDYEDKGLGAVTGNPADNGKFVPPTLRNIELTGPYMHDGRFETLEEVVNHYSNQVVAHPNLGDQLATNLMIGGTPKVHDFTDEEVAGLVAFLKTLTDWELIQDEQFSNPF